MPSQLNNINLSPPRQIIEVGDVFIDDKFKDVEIEIDFS
jgi:hypothetical protein